MSPEQFNEAWKLAQPKVEEGTPLRMAIFEVVMLDVGKFSILDREDAKLKINGYLAKHGEPVTAR